MAGSAKLAPALIESLFEPVPILYPTQELELAAAASGDKGCAFEAFDLANQSAMAKFIADARGLGLKVSRREIEFRDADMVMVVATRPDEEWRAEVIHWEFQARLVQGYVRSEASEYFRSRAFGYTHDQAVAWIEMFRHYTPVNSHDALYLFVPFATAKEISADGKLGARKSFTIAISLNGVGVSRDVLDRLPRGLAVGRAGFDWRKITRFEYQPGRTQIELSGRDLAKCIVSAIDFWDGERWSPQPRSSGAR